MAKTPDTSHQPVAPSAQPVPVPPPLPHGPATVEGPGGVRSPGNPTVGPTEQARPLGADPEAEKAFPAVLDRSVTPAATVGLANVHPFQRTTLTEAPNGVHTPFNDLNQLSEKDALAHVAGAGREELERHLGGRTPVRDPKVRRAIQDRLVSVDKENSIVDQINRATLTELQHNEKGLHEQTPRVQEAFRARMIDLRRGAA